MEVLQTPDDRGYPAEYLLARIRGRRADRRAEAKRSTFDEPAWQAAPAAASAEPDVEDAASDRIWTGLLREYRWVYTQMNTRLRSRFHPVFVHAELRTIFIGLRRLSDPAAGPVEELMGASLLSRDIRQLLTESRSLRAALADLEQAFPETELPRSLAEAFDAEGLRAVDRLLTHAVLEREAGRAECELVKTYFRRLIDNRNVLSLSMHIRFGMTAAPALLRHGSLPHGDLAAVAANRTGVGLVALVRRLTGREPGGSEPSQIEAELLRSTGELIRREGKDPLGEGVVLHHLWQCWREARNRGVLLYGRGLDRSILAAELI